MRVVGPVVHHRVRLPAGALLSSTTSRAVTKGLANKVVKTQLFKNQAGGRYLDSVGGGKKKRSLDLHVDDVGGSRWHDA